MKKPLLEFSMPLVVYLGTRKYIISMNNAVSWHRFDKGNIKKAYEKIVMDRVKDSIGMISCPVDLVFILHKGDKRKHDRSNALSLHEKYGCDGLVKAGILEEDNNDFIYSTTYLSGEIDRKKPRVEIKIYKH
jgi:hypothetical protein